MKVLADKYLPGETLRDQIPVLMHELGDLAKGVVYMDFYKKDAHIYKLYVEDAVADLLAQLLLVCARLGVSFNERCTYGVIRFAEKMKEVSK